jgi:hypothetical protein
MRTRRLAVAAVAVVVAFAAVGAASGSSQTTASVGAGFSAKVDNPWFPLAPGSRYVYVGSRDGQAARDVLTVTNHTRTIAGAECVVVSDRLYLSGRLHERTTDWYSQDSAGNVWYFGEQTAELDQSGKVAKTTGTWLAGVNGAKAGVYMFAHPKVGQSARQEYLKGQAEDHFQVLRLDTSVHVPAASSTHALLTKEWTPLEPGVLDHKVYVRGIGTVLEEAVKGGNERLQLVSFARGG